jgi:hypothetical protein
VPVLAAQYSVLVLAAASAQSHGDVAGLGVAMGIALLTGIVAWLISGLLSRDPDRRMLVSTSLVAWFAGQHLLSLPLRRMDASPSAILILSTLLLALAVSMIVRSGAAAHTAARFVRALVLILLAFPMVSLTSTLLGRNAAPATPPPRLDGARAGGGDAARDIYLIVLDKYSGSSALLASHGFDNGGFESALRDRGFLVPASSRSNYPHTWMSLASMLNWTFMEELLEASPDPPIRTLHRAVEDNRAWRFLRDRGYEFVFVPSTFPVTRRNEFADRIVPEAGAVTRSVGMNVHHAWLVSTVVPPLHGLLARSTAFEPTRGARFPYAVETAAEIEAKLAAIAGLAGEPGPRFVFAHLLVPHEPYIFEADCRHREPYWPPTDYVVDQAPIRRAYIAQIRCVNSMLLTLVDRILEASATEPIILLQSDHGHGMMAVNPLVGEQLPLDRLDPVQVAERTSAFAAYRLPDGGGSAVYEGITPVNILPSVFNYYFDASIPLREDAIFWARLHPPLELVRLE